MYLYVLIRLFVGVILHLYVYMFVKRSSIKFKNAISLLEGIYYVLVILY